MATTLRDIAAHLGLSPALISGVLNERPGVWASAETRNRIRAAARELGYRPHAAARALRSGKTYTVAFVFQGSGGPSGSPKLDGAIETLADRLGPQGYQLLVKVEPDRAGLLAALSDLLRARTCDAVVLWGPEESLEEPAALLERNEMPFVVKGRFEESHPQWPQADFDHEGMMWGAVRHLTEVGHRKIAYAGYDLDAAFTRCLRTGYTAAMEALVGPVPEEWLTRGGGDVEQMRCQLRAWLRLPEEMRPTALVNGAGGWAWRGIELALLEVGRRIDIADFAVAGQTVGDIQLLFGEGHAYRELNLYRLAEVLTEQLLSPLLAGREPERRVVRVLPQLEPTGSLGLLDWMEFRPQPL